MLFKAVDQSLVESQPEIMPKPDQPQRTRATAAQKGLECQFNGDTYELMVLLSHLVRSPT